jgi:phospholipid-binding lipoprotein MlaA
MKSLFCRFIFCMIALQLHAEPLSFDAQDPYQSINRKVHNFNMAFDATFLKQPARLYQAVLPGPVRAGVNNFFTNIHLIPSMANDILQGDWRYTIKDFWRFGINSTIGVGGIFDVAAGTFRLPPHSNDLGLTFAKWGNPTSPYIVIPFLGPSTIRDGMGMLFDFTVFSPYPYFPSVLFYPLAGLRYIDLRSQFLDQEPLLNQALDKYTFIRDAYLQHRQYVITGKEPNAGAIYLDEANEIPVLPNAKQNAKVN